MFAQKRRWRNEGWLVAAVLILSVSACDTPEPTASDASQPHFSEAQLHRAAMRERADGPLGADSVYHAIAGQVPGFAGFYLDRDGTRNILLVNPGRSEQARVAVAEYLQRGHGKPLGHSRIITVRYDFRQLYAWRTAILKAVAEVNLGPAMTSLGICEHENRVCIGARRGGGLSVISDVIARLGIPEDAVGITEEDPLQPLKTLNDTFEQVPGGVLIDDICSLGFNAYNKYSKRVFVTAAHCTTKYAEINPPDVFGQPDDGVRKVGVETYDPGTFACPGYSRCRHSDAAEITYYDSVAWRHGRIARPYLNQTAINPNYPEFVITDEAGYPGYPVMGMQLSRVGKSTGWWSGSVADACRDTSVFVDGVEVRLLCQSAVAAAGQPGDSGGPVFEETSNGVKLWGIMHTRGELGYWFSSMYSIQWYDGFGDLDTVSKF